jgi:hypothetical protein
MKKLILSIVNFWVLSYECTNYEKIIYIILKLWLVILIITFMISLTKIIIELLTNLCLFSNEKIGLISYI